MLRILLGGAAFVLLLLLVTVGGSVLQQQYFGSYSVTSDLGWPLVGARTTSTPDPFAAALQQSQPESLSVQLTLKQGVSRSSFDTTVEISGPVDQPVVRAVREGAALRQPEWLIAYVGGWLQVADASFTYQPPTVRLSNQTATIVVNGHASVPADTVSQILVHGPVNCAVFARRVIDVDLMDWDIVGIRPQGAVAPGCQPDSWPSQADRFARYEGARDVVVNIAPTAGVTPPPPVGRRPLVNLGPVGRNTTDVLSYAALVSLPLLLAWRRLRRIDPTSIGYAAALAVGALLVFHAVVAVANALSGPYYAIMDDVYRRLGPELRPYLYSVSVLPALSIVAVAVVWRRAVRHTIPNDQPPWGARSGHLVALVGCAALVIGTTAYAVHRRPVTSVAVYDWASWLAGWPGIVAAGAVFTALIAVATRVLLRRVVAARRVAGLYVLAASGGVLGFVAIQMVGYLYSVSIDEDRWSERSITASWLDWIGSTPGIVTSIMVVALLLGTPVLLVVRERNSNRHRVQIATGVAAALPPVALLVGVMKLFGDWIDSYRGGWLAELPSWRDWLDSGPGVVTVAAVCVLGSAPVAAVFVHALGVRSAARRAAAAGGALTMVLLSVAPLTYAGGILGWTVAMIPPLVAGALLWSVLARIVGHVAAHDPPRVWSRLTGWLQRRRGLGRLAALALAVPFVSYRTSGPPFDWNSFNLLADAVDGCLLLVTLVMLILVVRHLGGVDATLSQARGDLSHLRLIAILAAVVGLLTPTVTTAAVPVAFLVGWLMIEFWLLPGTTEPAARIAVGEPVSDGTVAAVLDRARAAAGVRATVALERGLRKKLAAGEVAASKRKATVRSAAALAVSVPTLGEDAAAAFGTYGGESPWQRAKTFALMGFAIGMPWTVLDAHAVFDAGLNGGAFRLLAAASSLLVLGRFAVAGFVLGAVYPAVRGRTGLAKGIALFLALTAPGLCTTLLPDPHAHGALTASLLQLTQWLSFGLILGLAADLRQLRMAGLGWRNLSDLHNLTALAASLSSVAVAVVTASVTALGTGAVGVMVDRLLPPPPVAATSTPAPKTP